ncbi:MAG: hypothetical protein ABS41_02315 [Arenimonas sp. SCN 70-307]|nr:MAG: hypothetical protein ABS41_02315 [Arenimonas sp. SCN 70-307]
MGTVSAISQPAFALEERLRFVEVVLLWEGLVRRQRVSDVFRIAPNHVTRDMRYYLDRFPEAIDFRPELRGYVPGPNFKPRFASDDPAEYLSLLQARADSQGAALLPLTGGTVQVGALPSPAMGIDRAVLKQLVRAIHQGQGLSVTYLAMRAEGPSTRTLWPHALLNTGLRWYVRAYDSESSSFRNFVIARISNAGKSEARSPVPSSEDSGWHKHVTAHVVLHPKLNAHQQAVVAREFGMKRTGKQWVWSVELRQCLAGHFFRRYGLDAKPPVPPSSHWVVLRNRAELRPYFLPGGSE